MSQVLDSLDTCIFLKYETVIVDGQDDLVSGMRPCTTILIPVKVTLVRTLTDVYRHFSIQLFLLHHFHFSLLILIAVAVTA